MILFIDGNKLTSPETAHPYLKEKLGFPDYYGCNLDALHECLTDICEETCFLIGPVSRFDMTPYYGRVLEVFKDSEKENPRITVECFEED